MQFFVFFGETYIFSDIEFRDKYLRNYELRNF